MLLFHLSMHSFKNVETAPLVSTFRPFKRIELLQGFCIANC